MTVDNRDKYTKDIEQLEYKIRVTLETLEKKREELKNRREDDFNALFESDAFKMFKHEYTVGNVARMNNLRATAYYSTGDDAPALRESIDRSIVAAGEFNEFIHAYPEVTNQIKQDIEAGEDFVAQCEDTIREIRHSLMSKGR